MPDLLQWTPHPIEDRSNPPLSDDQVRRLWQTAEGKQAALDYWERREKRIALSITDALQHGYELPHWHDARLLFDECDELFGLGGNGSAKTELGGKLTAELLSGQDGIKVLCVTRNDQLSKSTQQAAVYKYLPAHIKTLNQMGRKRSVTTKIGYSQANGFTDNTFVLPSKKPGLPGSQCWFKTVEQYTRDPLNFEGPEYDLVWIDEPAPIGLVNTLRYRVGKRGGRMLFTFTALDGYDGVCKDALDGATITKSFPLDFSWDDGRTIDVTRFRREDVLVEGCPPGHAPYILQPLDKRQAVICFWTFWNVFLPDINQILRKAAKDSKPRALCRLYGWPQKMSGCQFPLFKPAVHVIPRDKVPKKGTDYLGADPGTARSYFLLWLRVDELGRLYVFDESPNSMEGEWVTGDGEIGEGQKVFGGLGVDWYKRHIREREREHGMEAYRRKGDPRGFAAQAAARDGKTSLLEVFSEEDERAAVDPDLQAMIFEPSRVAARIALEIEKINDAFSYDEDKPVTRDNEPRLYVTENCENLIRSLINWAPDQGMESPWKDPIDALRYLFDEELLHVDMTKPASRRGGSY